MNAYSRDANQAFAMLAVKQHVGLPPEQGIPALVFDLASISPGPVHGSPNDTVLHLDTTSLDKEWGERIERCIADTAEDIECRGVPAASVAFVESTFMLDQLDRLCVFTKMRMDVEAKEGRRWKAVASVFRVGKKPVLMGPGDTSPFADLFDT